VDVTHIVGSNAITKSVNYPVAFILVNNRKDFATFYNTPQSRYEGFFVMQGDIFFKTLSRIICQDVPSSFEFYQGKGLTVVKCGQQPATFMIAKDEPVLVFEASTKGDLTVRLDMRHQFYIPQWGREYHFYEDGEAVVVRYSDDYLIEPIFMSILHDGKFQPLKNWVPVEYERDRQRNSEPTTIYEYDLGKFNAKKLVFAFGISETEALARARRYSNFSCIDNLIAKPTKLREAGDGAHKEAVDIAKAYAKDSLNDLFIKDRMLAGMPWFTKPWVRDELISVPALPKQKARAVILKYVHASWNGGKLPVIFGGTNCCSDGLGLLAWAILFSGISLGKQEREILASKVINSIRLLEETENEYGFIPSEEKESWMDSIGRAGYPLETQALYSKAIHLAYALTGSRCYEEKRQGLLASIRKHYFADGYLYDRLFDKTIRPNVFLASFFAPEILSKEEWMACFDRVLPSLWLKWGGLSSIDIYDKRFCPVSAGESDISYHNGDSWFFVNNIAALILYNLDRKKYADYIDSILNASTEEILWHNYIGRPGEISSAQALESWGCGLQGFSAAAYIYLTKRLSLW